MLKAVLDWIATLGSAFVDAHGGLFMLGVVVLKFCSDLNYEAGLCCGCFLT